MTEGEIIVPTTPVITRTGVYGNDGEQSYVVDYYSRGKSFNLFSLIYLNLASTDMLVVINDDVFDSGEDDDVYAGAWLYAEKKSDDRDFSQHYEAFCNLASGPSFLQIYKNYSKAVYEEALANPTTDSLAYSFTVARLGQIVKYELKPTSDAYSSVDEYLKATDFSGLSATEVAAKLTAGLSCTAVDSYGVTWNLLCPVTSWDVRVEKKRADFYPMLVIKEFEGEMTPRDVLDAPDVNLSPDAPEHLTLSLSSGGAASLSRPAGHAVSVRSESGSVVVDGGEADVFALDGHLVGRTSGGRLKVASGLYVVKTNDGDAVTVSVK